MKNNREYRDLYEVLKINENESESKIVEGYATTFNQPYELFRDDDEKVILREQVDPLAFADTDLSDVIFQYDHTGRVFCRRRNNTLEVMPDTEGLYIRANLGGTQIGRELYEEIKGGYTDKMSMGFTVAEDRYDETNEDGYDVYLRSILKIGRLYDVSAVSLPANEGTSISVRNLTDGLINKVRAERLEAHRKKELRKMLEDIIKSMKGN